MKLLLHVFLAILLPTMVYSMLRQRVAFPSRTVVGRHVTSEGANLFVKQVEQPVIDAPSGATSIPGAAEVAVCISGQGRTFSHIEVYTNIFATQIKPLGDKADVFVALHDEGAVTHNIFANALQHLGVDALRVAFWQQTPQGPNEHCPYKAGQEQAWGFAQCAQMIRTAEGSKRMKYQWVLRLRPDQFYYYSVPAYESWPSFAQQQKNVWTDYKGGCYTDMDAPNACLDDQVAFITRPAMDAYFDKLHEAYMSCDFPCDVLGDCAECLMGAVLTQEGVAKHSADLAIKLAREEDLYSNVPLAAPVLNMTLSMWTLTNELATPRQALDLFRIREDQCELALAQCKHQPKHRPAAKC